MLAQTVCRRKNTEFNCMELIDAILLLKIGNECNYDMLLSLTQTWIDDPSSIPDTIQLNNPTIDVMYYRCDMNNKQYMIETRIANFTNEIKKYGGDIDFDDIERVYISGKKNTHKKIEDINKGLNIKDKKADIYIEKTNGEIIGWSCKQSIHATKTNYSVLKMLDPENRKLLTNIKRQYLIQNGFPKHDKEKREEVNVLFYPHNKENPFWNGVREQIQLKKVEIVEELVKPLIGTNVNYPLYEFDGVKITVLNNKLHEKNISKITFEEHLPYYLDKKGRERKAAKLFYQLIVDEKIFRVELRWKGNIHCASPQFQVHPDSDQDHNNP